VPKSCFPSHSCVWVTSPSSENYLKNFQFESELEVFGLWFVWIRIQFCFANFESKSAPDPVPTRHKQSDSCLTSVKYKSNKKPVTLFQHNQNAIRIRLQQRKRRSWSCWMQRESEKKNPKPSPSTPLVRVESRLGRLESGSSHKTVESLRVIGLQVRVHVESNEM